MRLLLILALFTVAAHGQTPALPEKAAKYHSMLLKRPKPGAIFERFQSAWLEEGDIASLRTFLEVQAQGKDATTANRLVLGFFLSQQSEPDAALAMFAKALEADPDNADAWLLRAQTEGRVSKYEDAIKSLEHVKGTTGESAIAAIKLKAQMLARVGRTADALTALKELAQAHLEDEDLQDEVVELQLDEGLQGEALDSLKALLERTKDAYQRVLRRLRMGDVYKRMDRREEALAAYSQCLDDAAQDSWVESEVLAQIEQTFRSKDDIAGLKGFLAKLAEKHSQRLALGQLRARVLFDLNEGDDAIAMHRELVKANPGKAALKEAFIHMLARLQKYEDAVAQCGELLAERPKDKELRIHFATLLFQAKRPGEAFKELESLVADAKTPEFELLRVARLYESFDDPRSAKKIYLRATETYPASNSATDALASFLHARNEKPSAIELWKKLAKAPAPKEEVLRVARALGSRGEHEPALEILKAREAEFASDNVYLVQLIAAATGAQRPDMATGWATTLITTATDGDALDDALRQVRPVFREEKLAETQIKLLRAKPAPTVNERCLLAELLEQTGDADGATKALAGDDGVLMREQAHLYLLRQDYEKAAQILEKVAATKKEVSIVEQLVNLHKRTSNFDLALKWLNEWKILLPSSARPWLAEAQILQLQGKSDDAVKVLKQAARKVTNDISLKTALADAYTANNQSADAQRIYQTLYDEAEDMSAQIRWAGQLAETAQRRGALKELLDAFQERQRSNRTSISPWLAMAEIHRRTNSYEGRRNALLEASRLKPKDIDLLLQISKVDEDQGDWRKAIETLKTAEPLDKTKKTKQRMAEVHLRYGDEETGLRLAFELSGGSNTDPRDAEGMVIGLMTRGNWKGAVNVIDPVLSQNPEDYRLRYLKMLSLIEDDKVDEAINEAVTLMSAHIEVLTPSKTKNVTEPAPFDEQQLDPISEMIRDIVWSGSQALSYRQQLQQLSQGNRFFFGPATAQQYLFIPQQLRGVKPMVTALMVQAKVEDEWKQDKVAEVIQKLGAAGHPVPDCVRWFELGEQRGQQLKVNLTEVEQHLDQDKLVQFWINQAGGGTGSRAIPPGVLQQLIAQGVNLNAILGNMQGPVRAGEESPETKLLRRIYEHSETKNPTTAAMALLKLWQLSANKSDLIDKVVDMASKVPVSNTDGLYAYLGAMNRGTGPSAERTAVDAKLRDATISLIKRYSEAHPAEAKSWQIQIPRLHLASGDWDAFVTSLEAAIAASKERKAFRAYGNYSGLNVSIQPIKLYQIFGSIEAMPQDLMAALVQGNYNSSGNQLPSMEPDDAKALNEAAKKLQDPELRAIIAWRTGDKATFDAFVEAQMKADKPKVWALLAKSMEIEGAHHLEDAALLVKARAATTDRDRLKWIDGAFIHTVMMLRKFGKEEQAKPFMKDAETAVLALRRATAAGTYYEMEKVGDAMEALGMKDEAARQKKLVAVARVSQNRSIGGLNTSRTDPWQLAEDIRIGKSPTAVSTAVRGIKQFIGSMATSPSTSSYEFDSWTRVAKSKASDELWKQLTTSEPTTPRAKLERGLLADLFGKSEIAIPIYEDAVKNKPRDAFLRWQLAMALISKDVGDISKPLDHLLAVPLRDLDGVAGNSLGYRDNRPVPQTLALATLVLDFIERVKSKATGDDLTWTKSVADLLISSMGSYDSNDRLPNLLELKPKQSEATQEQRDRRLKLFERFCVLIADQPVIAEHVLPAMFAMANLQGKDTKEIVQQAKQTLSALSLSNQGGRRFFSSPGQVQKNYNGSYSGERAWTPQVPVMLLHSAKLDGSLATFEKEVLPLIRGAYDADTANDIALQLKLYTCEESEFGKLAKEYESRARRSQGGSVFKPTEIFRIAQTRGLKTDVTSILVSYVKAMVVRGYGMGNGDEVVRAFFDYRFKKEAREPVAPTLKAIFLGVLEKPEKEWPAFVNQNMKPTSSGFKRLELLGDVTGQMVRRDASVWFEVCSFLIRNGLQEHSQFDIEMSQSIAGDLPAKAADLIPVLSRTTLLQDMPNFFPGVRLKKGTKSYFDRVIDALQKQGTGYCAELVDALVEHQKQHHTFGAAMIIGRLSPITPDMKLTLEPCVKDFTELKTMDRKLSVLGVINGVWGSFDKEIKKPGMESLRVFVEEGNRAKEEKIAKWLKTDDIAEVSSPSARAVNELAAMVVDWLPEDASKAETLLRKGLQLIDASYAKGVWETNYSDGFNAQSELVQAVCAGYCEKVEKSEGEPSLILLPLLARVCLAENNHSAMYPFVDSKAKLGELLKLWFERHGGFADPRKTMRDMATVLTSVMGDTDVSSLLMPFYTMEPTLPQWYRAIVRSESYALADESGPNQRVAQEIAAAFALNKHDERGLVFIRQRMADPKTRPLLRAECAPLLARSSQTPPRLDDMKLCIDAIVPSLLSDGPGVGQMWEKVLLSFNTMPTTPEWSDLATQFRTAWMKRAQHYSANGNRTTKSLRPSTGSALVILELFARTASDDEMKAYGRKFGSDYERWTSTRLVLARHKRTEQLKEVMAANQGVATLTDKIAGLCFRPEDEEALEFMSKTISDPSIAALGRMQIVQVQDSSWKAPARSRAQRIADETKRALAMKDLKPSALLAMNPFIMDSNPAIKIAAPTWVKAPKVSDELRRILQIGSSDERKTQLESLLPLVVARLAEGDEAPWEDCLKVLQEWHKDERLTTGLLEDVAYRVGICSGRHLNSDGAAACGWIGRLVKDLSVLVSKTSKIDQTHGLSIVWFAQSRLAKTPGDYNAWRSSLPASSKARLHPTGSTWLPYALEAARKTKDEDGGAELLEILSHDWVRGSLKDAEDLSYKGKMPSRFSNETLRSNAAKLLKLMPDSKALLLTLMNAWADERDKRPLREAIQVVKAQIKDKRAFDYARCIELEAVLEK